MILIRKWLEEIPTKERNFRRIMEKSLKKKIRNKLWMLSSVLVVMYVSAIIINPTAWVALLPVIIPATSLTVGIPVYAIIRNTKEGLENLSSKTLVSEEKVIISKDDPTKNKLNEEILVEEQVVFYKDINETIIEKNKVKTKGTIHR